MNKLEQEFRKSLGPEFDHSGKPTVYFFDFAEPAESSDRPRFTNKVYISKTSKTSLGTQDFHRKMLPADRAEFPQEWAHYLAVKDNLSKPRTIMLPGIDEATLAEMRAINITSLEQLLAQDEFEPWRQLARRILDAISTERSEERQAVSRHNEGTVRVLDGYRTGSYQGGDQGSSQANGQKASYQKAGRQEITFEYEMIL